MKRLTFLAVIAMVTVATSSGCRTCGSPFSFFNRGDSCNTCDANNYGSGDGAYGSAYGSDMIYAGDSMLPPATPELMPGPQPAAQ